jgi:hypothetical protein
MTDWIDSWLSKHTYRPLAVLWVCMFVFAYSILYVFYYPILVISGTEMTTVGRLLLVAGAIVMATVAARDAKPHFDEVTE